MKKIVLAIVATLVSMVLAVTNTASAQAVLRLATTTSADNSGLLNVLLPAFEKAHGLPVQTISVGTGRALRLGENGDVDVLVVHARAAEEKFIDAGFGIQREEFMFNHFLIVGPRIDPAVVEGAQSAPQALRNIGLERALFLSRGDDSGTHKRELSIWEKAGLPPSSDWYREAGQGMGKVLQIAGELGAYTLTDQGTWLKLGEQTGLVELFSSDPCLYNPYSVIAVNPQRHPHVNYLGAKALASWLKSAPAQTLIDRYRIANRRAFTPLYLDN